MRVARLLLPVILLAAFVSYTAPVGGEVSIRTVPASLAFPSLYGAPGANVVESLRLWRATERWEAVRLFHATIRWDDQRARDEAERIAGQHRARQAARSHPRASQGNPSASGNCGGRLPPCWVLARESGGNLNAYNPSGCSGRGCYGKWQCDPLSCNGTGTEDEQDDEAARLWDGGRGCSHWAAC